MNDNTNIHEAIKAINASKLDAQKSGERLSEGLRRTAAEIERQQIKRVLLWSGAVTLCLLLALWVVKHG